MNNKMSRRSFLKVGSAAAAAMTVAPASVLGKSKKTKPIPMTGKLKILGVGIGGRGAGVLRELETEEFIGLADCDWKYAKPVMDKYSKMFPNCKMYHDYKTMFAELLDKADAVVVATSDHTHAIIAAEAMMAGKHVYCEKPLTRTVYECRLLSKLAAKYGVATQMGNQGASSIGTKLTVDYLQSGIIGPVTRVDAFTDRPIWPQGLEHPEDQTPPETLNWEAFIGPAPMRAYNEIYTPWNFRGWWDFGTGALGDMACHILHTVFVGLNLKYPIKIEGTSTPLMAESCPNAEIVKLTYPERENLPHLACPEVTVTWYDGGLVPNRPEGLPEGVNLNIDGGAAIFYGTKGIIVSGCYGNRPYMIKDGKVTPLAEGVVPSVYRKVETTHQQDWVRACKEPKEIRVNSNSDFSQAGPFTEMIAMGVCAVRLQGLNQVLDWDGENMKFTNIPAGAKVKAMVKDGFTIKDGHPTFKKTFTEPVDAQKFAAELIKPVYQNGYTLPELPA